MFKLRGRRLHSFYKKALSAVLSLCIVAMTFPTALTADAAIVNDTDNPAFSVIAYDTSVRVQIPAIEGAISYQVYLTQNKDADLAALTVDTSARCVSSSSTYKSYDYVRNSDTDKLNSTNTVLISQNTTYYFYLVTNDGSTNTLQSTFQVSTKETTDCYWTSPGHYDTSWYTSGTTEYTISTEAQLAGLAVLNNGLNGVDAVDFSGKTIKLSTSLNMSACLWTPIGTYEMPFKGNLFDGGVYDGDTRTGSNIIMGLHTNADKDFQGLFGRSKSNIQNLGVVDGCVIGKSNVAGIVGWCEGSITNCYNTGMVSGLYRTAGIAAYEAYHIRNCYNTGTITGSYNYTAGLAGESGTIYDSYNSGSIHGGSIVGGIVGNGPVSACYNTGTVMGDEKVGGIAGHTRSEAIECSFNIGKVSGAEDAGGIVGYADVNTIIDNSYNTGTISGNIGIGGISGYYGGYTLFNCYSSGTVSAASDQFGGIVGQNASGDISNCYYNSESVTTDNGVGTRKTSAELKNIADLLNIASSTDKAFVSAPTVYASGGVFSADNPVNGGYPVLTEFGYKDGSDIDGPFGKKTTDSQGFNIYDVKNAYQLDLVRNYTSYTGDYFKLSNNIDLSPVQLGSADTMWISIGDKYGSSPGTIDGNGFSISSITGSSLVGYNWHTIKNLGVTDVNIQTSTYNAAGGIAAKNDGIISNCASTGVIAALSVNGGIAGANLNNFKGTASISGCRSACAVGGIAEIGGIIGGNNCCVITDCSNIGTVYSMKMTPLNSNYPVGGIAGKSAQEVTNCWNFGRIAGYNRIGGIVGDSTAAVTHCLNSGTVSGDQYVGGIVGLSDSNSDGITCCDNAGNVQAIASGSLWIGGIAGCVSGGQISKCRNTGVINENSQTGGKGSYIGGIVGSLEGTATDCCNEGTVEGKSDLAGIAAEGYEATISACYNTGAVSSYKNNGVTSGIAVVCRSCPISNCYNTGIISGINASGILWTTNSSVSNCCYCGAVQGIGGSSQLGAIPFAMFIENSVKAGGSTTITQLSNLNGLNGTLGTDLAVSFGNWQSDSANIATVSGLNVTGGEVGKANISCTMEITQNELDVANGTGFTGTAKTISAPVSLPLTVTKATPSITAASGTATVGEPVTLAANITSGYHPTGKVIFKNNGIIVGSTNSITNGTAQISYTPVSMNDLCIVAEYNGDKNNEFTSSVPITVAVNKKSPVLSTVKATPDSPQSYPVSVLLSSTLSNYFGTLSGVPVSFYNGDTLLGSGETDEHGVASYTFMNPNVDTYQLRAKFVGNTCNNPVNTNDTSYTINKGEQAALTIGGIPAPVTYGDKSFTLSPSGGSGTGTTYTFESGNPDVLSVDGSGKVTVNSAGEATLTVTKAGDANYNPISKSVTVTVAQKALNATIVPNDKQYDTTANASVKNINYSGIVGFDDVFITGGSIAFTDKMVSSQKEAIANGYSLGGTKSANYTTGTIHVIKAAIHPATLTIQNTEIKDKIYNGTASAQFLGAPTLHGILSGDKVNLLIGNPDFANKNYSSNLISVDVSVFGLSGADAQNYTFTQPGNVYAHISKKALNVSVAPVTIKCGQSILPLSVKVSGFVEGENENNISGFSKPLASPVYSEPTTSTVTNIPMNIVYSGGNATNNYKFSYSDATNLTVQAVSVQNGDYEVSGKYAASENPVDWNADNFTVTPSNGYNLVSTDGITWKPNLTISSEGKNRSVTFKLKKEADGIQTESNTIYYNLDKSIPTVHVTGNPVDLVKSAKLTIDVTTGISGIKSVKVNGNDITDSYKNGCTVTQNSDYKFTVTNGAGVTAEQIVQVSNIQPTVILGTQSNIKFDLSNVILPAGITSVSVSGAMLPQSGTDSGTYTAVNKLINNNFGSVNNLMVYDLKLLDQNGDPITNFTGKIKVKIPMTNSMRGIPNIFWYDPANNALTNMNAVAENGYLVFETTHFSYYAVAELKTVSASVPNTPTDSKNISISLLVLLSVGLAGFFVVKKRMKYRVKK